MRVRMLATITTSKGTTLKQGAEYPGADVPRLEDYLRAGLAVEVRTGPPEVETTADDLADMETAAEPKPRRKRKAAKKRATRKGS